MPIPPLRPLDTFPYNEEDGRKLIGIRDPLGVVEGILGVSPEAFFIASHFDGERDADSLSEYLTTKMNAKVPPSLVERVRDIFSERALLQDAAFSKIYENAREQFARSPSRPAAHAGSNYPVAAEDFRIHIGGILADAWDQPPPPGRLLGLIAPHIDLERGHVTYARAYGALRDIGKVDRFIILGTAHGPTSNLLIPTRKDYDTPLGPARTDREAVNRAVSILGADAYDDEYVHKNEHSIEFQTIFLKLLHPNAQIVPFLCGSLRPICEDGVDPNGHPEVETAVLAMRAAMDDNKRTVVIAGADLAHVGPRFGGGALTQELLNSTETADRAALDCAAERSATRWFESVTDGGDPRNTCGLAPIYLLLRALDRGRGHLLSYRRCEGADQCVTIGAMAFVDEEPPSE